MRVNEKAQHPSRPQHRLERYSTLESAESMIPKDQINIATPKHTAARGLTQMYGTFLSQLH
jgi:hypothetical protein